MLPINKKDVGIYQDLTPVFDNYSSFVLIIKMLYNRVICTTFVQLDLKL